MYDRNRIGTIGARDEQSTFQLSFISIQLKAQRYPLRYGSLKLETLKRLAEWLLIIRLTH